MKSRWFSTFTVIGFVLLILGIVGLALQHGGSNFVFDPGQPPPASGQDHTPWYYLIVGALMVLNGLVTPAIEPAAVATPKRTVATNPPAAVNPSLPPAEPDTVVTSADKSAES